MGSRVGFLFCRSLGRFRVFSCSEICKVGCFNMNEKRKDYFLYRKVERRVRFFFLAVIL